MYICKECGREFSQPRKLKEKHGLASGPYEILAVCPTCKSTDYQNQSSRFCRCCGAKLKEGSGDYCSISCRINSEKQRARESKRKKALFDSELYRMVRETEKYNATHGTGYSYGQYVAIVCKTKERKMHEHRKKEIS